MKKKKEEREKERPQANYLLTGSMYYRLSEAELGMVGSWRDMGWPGGAGSSMGTVQMWGPM